MKTVTVSDKIRNWKLLLGTSHMFVINRFINNNRKLIVFL